MRILLVCDTIDGRGGWYTYTRDLLAALEQNGHTVAVCCRRGSQGRFDVLSPPLAYVRNPLQVWRSALSLKKTVHEFRPDIIHITVEPYAMMLPFLGKRIAIKTVLTIHGSYGIRPLEHFVQRTVALRYYGMIARFITVSSYTKKVVSEELQTRKGADFARAFEKRTTVVHNGIVLPKQWGQHPQAKEKKQILLVGGVKPRKGVLEALDACGAYKEKWGADFTFALVGTAEEGTYLRDVRRRIEALQLQEQVQILGPVSQEKLDELYCSSDLYLMPALTIPNTFEGFGLVYLEANAFGIPCIGPDTSGASEAIADGESGFCVDPKNALRIAECMHKILDEQCISRKQCRTWAEKHSLEKASKEIESVYSMVQSAL